MLLHASLWIGVVTMLDLATSWIMMTLRGASFEGNPTMRLLFESRNLPALTLLISQQYLYLYFVLAGLVMYIVLGLERVISEKWFVKTFVIALSWIVILLTWFFAFVRLYLGPPSNTVAILLPYGGIIALIGGGGVLAIVFWLMLSDIKVNIVIPLWLRN
jgi:hypothetical protein